jgi:predicted nuclease of predicted toxin-antitoxin system
VKSFLIDNQLPAALAKWLGAHGQRATHVLELQFGQAGDAAIWVYAAQHGCVIATKDEDFVQLSLLRPELVPVIWIRLGNCRTKDLLSAWENSWPRIIQELEAGARLIELY